MQLFYNETLSAFVCVRACLHCMNGAAKKRGWAQNPSADSMSPAAMAKFELEGRKAIGANQRKHLRVIQRERGNYNNTITLLRLTESS